MKFWVKYKSVGCQKSIAGDGGDMDRFGLNLKLQSVLFFSLVFFIINFFKKFLQMIFLIFFIYIMKWDPDPSPAVIDRVGHKINFACKELGVIDDIPEDTNDDNWKQGKCKTYDWLFRDRNGSI